MREAEREFQPFHQRSFFAAHPELTFTQLNGDVTLTTSPYHEDGVLERMALIRDKMPGVEEIVTRTPPPGAASAYTAAPASRKLRAMNPISTAAATDCSWRSVRISRLRNASTPR